MILVQTLTIALIIFPIGIGYRRSKTLADKLRFTLIPISIIASIAFPHFIVSYWKSNNFGDLSNIYQLQIFPLLLIECYLIASIVICFCAWIKKGFANLEKFESFKSSKFGLIYWVNFLLIIGAIFGLIMGLGLGLGGLILGMSCTLFVGLLAGLNDEFKIFF